MSRPNQKFGMACPMTAMPSAVRSTQVLRFNAAMMPSGRAMRMAITNPIPASESVTGNRVMIRFETLSG